MRLRAEQLAGALAKGLASTYLVAGDEPLLVAEACDAIRAAARAAGYSDRRVFFIERGFIETTAHFGAQGGVQRAFGQPACAP